MDTKHTKQSLINTIIESIQNNTLQFPFKRNYIDASKVFNNLVNLYKNLKIQNAYQKNIQSTKFMVPVYDGMLCYFNFKTILFPLYYIPLSNKEHPIYIVNSVKDEDYKNTDILSDYFMEPVRLKSNRRNKPSVIQQWGNPEFQHFIVDKLVNNYYKQIVLNNGQIDMYQFRELIYKHTSECTQFKPSLSIFIIKFLFNGNSSTPNVNQVKMLDFSAGWGDRLLGAMACGIQEYTGFDPNTLLKDGHTEMISMFSHLHNNMGKYIIIYEGFENARVEPDYYDLVLTSPPFFDFETYFSYNSSTQSIKKYPNKVDWVTRFLFVCVEKAWKALKTNGYLVLHYSDVSKESIVEPINLMIGYCLENANYCGVIFSKGSSHTHRPLWVWQKINIYNDNKNKYYQNLINHYPEYLI